MLYRRKRTAVITPVTGLLSKPWKKSAPTFQALKNLNRQPSLASRAAFGCQRAKHAKKKETKAEVFRRG
jgi:hypothetical protein